MMLKGSSNEGASELFVQQNKRLAGKAQIAGTSGVQDLYIFV